MNWEEFEENIGDNKNEINFRDDIDIKKSILKEKKVDYTLDYPDYDFDNDKDNNNNNNINNNHSIYINNNIINNPPPQQMNQIQENPYIFHHEQNEPVQEVNINPQIQIHPPKPVKKERTVEDIGIYDPSYRPYLSFITHVLNNINQAKSGRQMSPCVGGSLLAKLCNTLSTVCEKIARSTGYKFIPRPVQLLAIIRLAELVLAFDGSKGSIGEIKTGEGKSYIVYTLAIVICQFGKKVDITTSNIELASRDHKEQEENFKLFGI